MNPRYWQNTWHEWNHEMMEDEIEEAIDNNMTTEIIATF